MEFTTENSANFISKGGAFVNQEDEVIIEAAALVEKGFTIDDQGNLIDPTSKVIVKAKDDFLREWYGAPAVVKPEGTPAASVITFDPTKGYVKADGTSAFDSTGMKFNETGDVVDEAGEILKTNADILEWYGDGDEEPIEGSMTIAEIQKLTGLQVLDTKGQPMVFDDTLAGLAAYTSAVAKQAEVLTEKTVIERFFKANPDIHAVAKYKQTKGTTEGFGNYVDYSKVALDETNIEQLKDVIRQHQLSLDKNPDRAVARATAEKYVVYAEKEGILKDTATASLQSLTAAQVVEQTQASLAAKAREEAEEHGINEYIDTVKNKVVTTGKLTLGDNQEFDIPERILVRKDGKVEFLTRADFYDYFIVPKFTDRSTGENLSQFDVDERSVTNRLDLDIFKAYGMFTGQPESAVIKAKVGNEKVKDLKAFITDANGKSKSKGKTIFDIPGKAGIANVNTNN